MKSFMFYILLIPFCMFNFQTLSASGRNSGSPGSFLQNKGQWQNEILYRGHTNGHNVYFLKDGLSFAQIGEEVENEDGSEVYPSLVWNMKFVNSNPSKKITAIDESKSVISYISGNDSTKWIIHPEQCSRIKYSSVYPGIDLLFYNSAGNLKYDYIVHKGGSVDEIVSTYEGIKNLQINADGELEVVTEWNTQVHQQPVAWQIIKGKKVAVNVYYTLVNDSTFGFEVPGGFDKNYDLIIDPLFQMVWSSYTNIPGGSNNMNYCFSNAMDADGNVYLTGYSDDSFPITPGAYSNASGIGPEIYIAKFSADGSTLIYWTYLLGTSSEFGADIQVDEFGRAYVTGTVELNITGVTTFATTTNAYQQVHNTGSDAFLTVLNAAGSGLVYSTFIGGTGSETGYDLALALNGIAYVTGYTSIGNFPVVNSTTYPSGDNDAFVAKFDINQSGAGSLIYSTRIGAGSFSYCKSRSIAVDNAGNAYITGTISSTSITPAFPITPGAYNTVYNGGQDGAMFFVAKLSAITPVTLLYSTYVAPGTGNAIDVNKTTGEVFVAGTTYTFAFPTTPGVLQPVHAGAGGTDAFVVKLDATGSVLDYATFLGGVDYDQGTGLAVNSAGEAYICGITQNQFPTSPGAYQPNNAGTYDFFVVQLNTTATGYGCGGSTYVGGSDADYAGSFYDYPSPRISIQDHGGFNDTISISSTSHSQDFPTTPGVFGPVKVNGIADQPVFFKMTCVPAGAAPNVNLSSSDTSWCDKKAIDYFDLSTNNPVTWSWYFQGATPDTSTLQNPTGIYYPAYGTFDVKLVACNASGCDSMVLPAFITEYQLAPAPVISQSADTLYSTPAYSYQWYDLNGPLPGATSVYYVPPVPQTYFVIITDSLGCSSPSGYMVISDIPEASGFNHAVIIPNPARDEASLFAEIQRQGHIIISLEDISGRTVKLLFSGEAAPGPFRVRIDLQELESGIYYCTIRENNNSRVLKLMRL